MLDSMLGIPLPYVSLEQALINIIDSISKEEIAVAAILESEGDIIQKAKNFSDNVDEYISLNISVNNIIKNIARLQILLQLKLEEAQSFLCKVKDIDDFEE